jgi:hypothetical protein
MRSEPQHPQLGVRHGPERAGQAVVDDLAAGREVGNRIRTEQVRRRDVQPTGGGSVPGQIGQSRPGHRPPVGQPGPVLGDQSEQDPSQFGLGGFLVVTDRGPGDAFLEYDGGRLEGVIVLHEAAGQANEIPILPVPVPQLVPQQPQNT